MSVPSAVVEKSKGLRAWLLQDVPDSITQARVQRFYLAWLTFRRNPIAMTGFLIIATLVVMAAFAPLLTATSGLEPQLEDRLQPASAEHWFGTDGLGRDIYDRIVWGSRITLYIVGLVGIIVVPVGLVVGTLAGYVGGAVDTVLMRITDIFLAFHASFWRWHWWRHLVPVSKTPYSRSHSPPGLPTRVSRAPRP